MSQVVTVWGYKPNGDALVFIKLASDPMPEGWSMDKSVIVDPAHKDGFLLTQRAGESVKHPIPASNIEAIRKARPEPVAEPEQEVIGYDDKQQPVVTKKPRPVRG